jgi:predicted transposase YbfD/YdcC
MFGGILMSNDLYQGGFFDYFGGLQDTRQEGKVYHRLIDILFIVFGGILCGHDDWEHIYIWASAVTTQMWLKKYIALNNGMPSLSTIKRGFGILAPEEFSARFIEWIRAGVTLPDKDIVSIDGKTSKGSRDASKEQKALHMVSALCHSHGLIIGQTKTDEKSNEITAIPELLDQLLIEGCIVTIDAMGLQKKIVKKIVKENQADYVINLKGNQETLQQEVKEYFEDLTQTGEIARVKQETAQQKEASVGAQGRIQILGTLDKGHGRIEKRTYFYSTDLDWMVDAKQEWEKLTGIGMVVREVEFLTENKKTNEIAYYVSSVNNVRDFSKAARMHWGVESMHWSLDVTFKDDQNQTRLSAAAQNLAVVRRMVFNTLKQETQVQPKMSKPKKRTLTSVDEKYRDLLIQMSFNRN